MTKSDQIEKRIAQSLLRQREPKQRRKLILIYSSVFVGLFLLHAVFSNWGNPLKLIPQTMAAIAMGYMLFCVFSVKQFNHIATFIDWEKVNNHTEPSAGENVSRPTA